MSVGRMGLVQAGSPDKQCPTLAELTADATATASQIAEGATAYVQGEKITGTMPITIDVAEAGIKFAYSTFGTIPSYFDFSNVINGDHLFSRTKNIKSFNRQDFESMTICQDFLSYSGIEEFIGSGFKNVTNSYAMFYQCVDLVSFLNFEFSKLRTTTSMFYRCTNLTYFKNTSTIKTNLSLSYSPLLDSSDAESSILGMLADLTGKTSQTITFNTALQSGISESAIQAATDKNWVVNFADN